MSDLDRDARALVQASRDGDRPSELERARVRRKLMAAIGAAGAAGATSPAHASTHVASGAAKLGAGAGAGAAGKIALTVLALAAATSGIALWSRARVHAPVPVATPAQPIAQAPVETAPVPLVQPAAAVVEAPDAPQPQARTARLQERTHAASHERARSVAHAADALPNNVESRASDAITPQVADAPVPAQTQVAGAHDALSRELALINQAQRAVRAGQSERALQLLQRHAAQFPAGALLQERFATQALALCALGRVAEGQRAIGELARISASSPLLGSARRSCAAAAAH
jgi:hypothetical protein